MQYYTQAQIDDLCLAALNFFQVDNGVDAILDNVKSMDDTGILRRTVLITNRAIAYRSCLAHCHFLLTNYNDVVQSLPESLGSKFKELHERQFETLKRWNNSYDVERTLIENYIQNWQE